MIISELTLLPLIIFMIIIIIIIVTQLGLESFSSLTISFLSLSFALI